MTAAAEQQFCLRWHNYQSSLLASLPQLLDGDDLTDVTLSAGGFNLRAHKVVLSACSQYFKELFKMLQPMQHPVIVLPGANFTDLCALVTFMYSGEVNIYQDQLQGLLNMANAMQIRGLGEVNGKHESSPSETKIPHLPTKRQRLNQDVNPQTAENIEKAKPQRNEFDSAKRSQIDFSPIAKNLKPYKLQGRNEKELVTKVERNKGETSGVQKRNILMKTAPPPLPLDNCELLNKMDELAQMAGGSSSIPPSLSTQHPKTPDDSTLKIKSEPLSVFDTVHEPGYPDDLELLPSNLVTTAKDLNSPTSCESASSPATSNIIYSVDTTTAATTERMQLSQGSNLATNNNKLYLSSQSTKLWSGGGVSTSSSKLFATCAICGKQLSNQYNLRVHMETHQNMNYACNVCSHVSRSRDALRKHVSYRHGVGGGGGGETRSALPREPKGARAATVTTTSLSTSNVTKGISQPKNTNENNNDLV